MEFNYYAVLMNEINQTYQKIRMQKDLPWNYHQLEFLNRYLNVKNVSEVDQLMKHLNLMEQRLLAEDYIYNSDLLMIFTEQQRFIKAAFSLLTQINEEYNQLFLEDQTSFTNFLISDFKDRLDYLLLSFKEFVLVHQNVELISYLLEFQKQWSSETINDQELLIQVSDFYLKIEQFCHQINVKNLWNTPDEKAFFQSIKAFNLKTKLFLNLYYKWLNQDQIIDEKLLKFSAIYA